MLTPSGTEDNRFRDGSTPRVSRRRAAIRTASTPATYRSRSWCTSAGCTRPSSSRRRCTASGRGWGNRPSAQPTPVLSPAPYEEMRLKKP